ncbi:hypothetical protein [Zhongshania marina]
MNNYKDFYDVERDVQLKHESGSKFVEFAIGWCEIFVVFIVKK